uniref:Major facilitator superfamily (MFS) profile domain-containing protein n=2 Tax=Rhodnius prolixus TaxID=13249 RepID=T1I8A6_RHOPR
MVVRGLCGFGVRHVQCFLISFTYCVFYLQKSGLELCILLIAYNDKKQAALQEQLLEGSDGNYTSVCLERIFMAIMSLLFGAWSVHRGVKFPLLGIVGIFGALAMYSTSTLVEVYTYQAIIILRTIYNVLYSVLEPLLYSLISNWVADHEKGSMALFIFSGQLIGEFLQGIVGFYLGKLKNEWSQILFWSGNCCSLWTLAWFSFGANHPKECFYMDRNERKFLQNRQRYKAKYGVAKKIPWASIFLNIEIYPVIFAHCCLEWAFASAHEHITFYFIKVYRWRIETICSLKSYGHFCSVLLAILLGIVVDKLATKKNISLSKLRKVITCIGMWGAGMMLPFLGHAPSLTWAKYMGSCYYAFATPVFAGLYLTHLDFSPNFCTVLFGISNGVAYLVTLGVPFVRSALVIDE